MEGPLLLNAGDPNSTFVPCLKETLWEFVKLLKTGPFPLKIEKKKKNLNRFHEKNKGF